jgi:hypothetical protein
LARDQAGRLSHEQSVALRAHLASCASCRLARDVYADFEADAAVELDDGARLERLAAVARAAVERRARPRARDRAPARRARWRTLAFAAAVVLACGSASAAVWWWRRAPAPDARVAAAAVAPTSAAGARQAARAAPAPVDDAVVAAPAAAAVSLAPAPTPARAGGHRARPARAGDVSGGAALLLREAGDARRAGDAARAIALYRRLQSEFAGSPEAVLSALPLGGLLLDAGSPGPALAQFDGYLAAARGGALAPEALYGRGRALARLGDRDGERRAWQRLLEELPDSAYAPHARRRLAELQ